MKGPLLLAVVVVGAVAPAAALHFKGREVVPYNRSQIGLVDLPAVDADPSAMPPFCFDFSVTCALEKEMRYEAAFQLYEERYKVCGDAGWTLQGSTHGLDAQVAFKTTPCGTIVAVKGSREIDTLSHIKQECTVLKELSENAKKDRSVGYFPAYYYWSPRSQACYSGFVAGGISVKINIGQSRYHNVFFRSVKALVLQAIDIVRVLVDHNIEHRDLTFRNMIVTGRVHKQTPHFSVVVLDFGASGRTGTPVDPHRHVAGNKGHSDLFTMVCQFALHLVPGHSCMTAPVSNISSYNTTSLAYAVMTILNDTFGDTRTQREQLTRAASLVQSAQSYF